MYLEELALRALPVERGRWDWPSVSHFIRVS